MNIEIKEPVHRLIETIEETLANVYQSKNFLSVRDFLVDQVFLKNSGIGIPNETACVIVDQRNSLSEEDIFIGVFLHERVLNILAEQNPQEHLSGSNLNALCILIEEISHFHLVSHRIQEDSWTSQIELELQGEIDKLIILSQLIFSQNLSTNMYALTEQLYGKVKFVNQKHFGRYREANDFAYRFWHHLISQFGSHPTILGQRGVREFLQRFYRLPWTEKVRLMNQRHNIAA